MSVIRAAPGWRRCQPGYALVELVLATPLLLMVVVATIEFAWWGHAQNVVTAAVQDGARIASAQDGSLDRGVGIAEALLHDGLGPSATLVTVQPSEDQDAVTLEARGRWPLLSGAGVEWSLPLGARARILRERWRP